LAQQFNIRKRYKAMNIKPTGPGGPPPPVSDSSQPVERFSKPSRPAAPVNPQTSQALKSITADFRKADLQDPAKVDQMVSRCTSELVESALAQSGANVSPQAKAQMAELLENDVVFRGKVVSFCKQVLS
jgi:hypothetical protein